MASYATAADVASYLGRTFTSPQETQVGFYISAASAWIDQWTGRTWSKSSPATERHTISVPYVYTNIKPITAVTSFLVRDLDPGSESIALVDGEGYELIDASRGLISLDIGWRFGSAGVGPWQSPYYGYQAIITFTHPYATPDNIKLSAIILAASKMNLALNPMGQRLRSFSDNRAVSVTFKDGDVGIEEAKLLLPPKQVFLV